LSLVQLYWDTDHGGCFINSQVATFGSTVGGESPEETLQRIAQGQFGGRVNGTSSSGGTYSPPLNDDFNPFDQWQVSV
jgi:hypothetical protein